MTRSAVPSPLPVAIAFAAGIALALVVDVPTSAWLAGAVGIAIVGAIAMRRVRGVIGAHALPIVVIAGALALGGARGAPAVAPLPAGVVADDMIADRVVGVVGAPVLVGAFGFGAPLELDGDAATIWLWTATRIAPGDRLAATGRVHTPRGLLDPAAPDRAALVASRGARYELTASTIEHLGDDAGAIALAWRAAAAAQARWSAAIDAAGGDAGGRAALRGIILGDRHDVDPQLDQRWRVVGIYHVLSVSGLHLAVVAGLVFAVLRRLIAASPWGGRVRPARWAAPPALALAIAYTLVTGAQLATLRALVVIALMLLGALLDRPLRLVDALGLAAIALLAWRPADLLDPSFQLSFVAALTLALRPHAPRAAIASRLARIVAWIRRGIVTSAWVALTTAPITAFHFHQVAAGGIVGNLILTPLCELIALPLGLAGLIVGELAPSVGAVLIAAAADVIAIVDAGAGQLARVTPMGIVTIATPAVMLVLTVLSIAIAARARRTRVDLAAWVALCLVWTLGRTPPAPGVLRVTFLDVGQGDGALLELPNGNVWLVDAGGVPGAADLAAATASGRAILRVLQAYGHDHVDIAIISHPHPDHYLGLLALAEAVPIRELWSAAEPEPLPDAALAPRPRTRDTFPSFRAITETLVAHGTRVVHPPLGVARDDDGVTLMVWAPRYQPAADAPISEGADPVRTVNDNSLVVSVGYRGRAILFTGDLEAEGEDAVVAAGVAHVDVVKVPHHGSPTSSTSTLISATAPRYAVISCGRGNHFGFPSAAVVARWQAGGAEVARTDEDGAVTITIDAAGGLAIDRFAGPFAGRFATPAP